MSFREIHAQAIFFPTGGYGPDITLEDGPPSYPSTDYHDNLPPITVVTRVTPRATGEHRVEGFVSDDGVVQHIQVNDQRVAVGPRGCSQWTTTPRLTGDFAVTAFAEDNAGNRELVPWSGSQKVQPAGADDCT